MPFEFLIYAVLACTILQHVALATTRHTMLAGGAATCMESPCKAGSQSPWMQQRRVVFAGEFIRSGTLQSTRFRSQPEFRWSQAGSATEGVE
ncbi:MAG: hypothetical protein AB7K09_14500 [Planctomycetota bacterium]